MAAKYAVFAKLPNGRTVSLWVTAEESVLSLRNAIAAQTSMDVGTLAVTYAGKLLQDDATMGSARVGKEAIIHIMIRKAPAPQAKMKSACCASSSSSFSCSSSSPPSQPTQEDKVTEEMLISSFASGANTKGVDICFVFDTTGSMSSVIENVKTQVMKTCTTLCEDLVGIRISIMSVGDYCDQANYVVSSLDFSNNPKQITDFVHQVTRTSGGDAPEAYEWALHKCRQLAWRNEEDVGKAVVLIADAEPHPPSYTSAKIFWQDELDALADMGVKCYGVQALDYANVTPFYQRLAERTGGLHIRFSNFHLITQMFLAVCYREAGEDKLQEFREKTEGEKKEKSESASSGRGGEMEEIMETLARPLEQKKVVKSKINCSKLWFSGNCRAGPKYYYCSKTDTFTPWSNQEGENAKALSAPPPSDKAKALSSAPPPSDKGKEAEKVETPSKRGRGFSFSSWFPWRQ